jgi:hypothetical protein
VSGLFVIPQRSEGIRFAFSFLSAATKNLPNSLIVFTDPPPATFWSPPLTHAHNEAKNTSAIHRTLDDQFKRQASNEVQRSFIKWQLKKRYLVQVVFGV